MKRLLFFAALLLGVLGFLFWTGQPETPAPPPETASESADAEPSRVKIPQPSLPTRTSTEDPADDTPEVEEAPPTDPPSATGTPDEVPNPTDTTATPPRRYPLPVPRDMTAVAISGTIKSIIPEIEDCLDAWSAVDVRFTGHVAMGMEIGPDGLTDLWIDDVEDIPDGPLTCLGSAIWGADWPPFIEPTTVQYPFQVEILGDQEGAQ